ncbi:MAG: response regulator [Gammaproteobacteria bacterium]
MKEVILIVDDSPVNLKLAKVLLMTEGYDVHTAIDADDALQVLTSLQPDIILMDLQLPGMDGLQLTRKIKMDPKYRDIIILAVTAYAMKGDDQKAYASGCDGYITKPIDVNTLPGIIAEYLMKKNRHSGLQE